NTAFADGRTGIAWFAVEAEQEHGQLSAHMEEQGYINVSSENVLFPSIGVTGDGNAIMSFTLVGPDFFPSAAYVRVGQGSGNVHTAAAGVGPTDGFSEYGDRPRWGDYSAAVAAPDGAIWLATEYIGQTCTDAQFAADRTCGNTRSTLANWGTFISRVNAEGDD